MRGIGNRPNCAWVLPSPLAAEAAKVSGSGMVNGGGATPVDGLGTRFGAIAGLCSRARGGSLEGRGRATGFGRDAQAGEGGVRRSIFDFVAIGGYMIRKPLAKSPANMRWLTGAISVVALIACAPVSAQQAENTEQELQGQLDGRSSKFNGSPYQVRTMRLEAGRRYAFSARSEEFDPALRISFADDNDEQLAEDDDGGEGTEAYLEFSPEKSGTYRVRLGSVNGDGGGYLLTVRDLAPLPPLLRPSPTGGDTIVMKHYAGALTEADGEIRGHFVDDYQFHFVAGKPVLIFLDRDSDEFDPFLEVRAAGQRNSSDLVARDDDSGERMNAFITFTPEMSGDFIVRATSSGGSDESGRTGRTGRYMLRVGQQP